MRSGSGRSRARIQQLRLPPAVTISSFSQRFESTHERCLCPLIRFPAGKRRLSVLTTDLGDLCFLYQWTNAAGRLSKRPSAFLFKCSCLSHFHSRITGGAPVSDDAGHQWRPWYYQIYRSLADNVVAGRPLRLKAPAMLVLASVGVCTGAAGTIHGG